ncbi:hypothetical protein [Pedobacter sp. ASV28]|uniref:hypothetical protein n=1 Tax=Pedobacter sp. ASV28 TaxID=2795123 RepID=UPI0018ED0A8F|nr:hypothetical protein [Pedobacter sp. ASV28]
MEQFNISGPNTFTAILNMLVELNVRTMAITEMIAENSSNGRTYEENINEMKSYFSEAKKIYLENLYVQLGDLNLGNTLGGK